MQKCAQTTAGLLFWTVEQFTHIRRASFQILLLGQRRLQNEDFREILNVEFRHITKLSLQYLYITPKTTQMNLNVSNVLTD